MFGAGSCTLSVHAPCQPSWPMVLRASISDVNFNKYEYFYLWLKCRSLRIFFIKGEEIIKVDWLFFSCDYIAIKFIFNYFEKIYCSIPKGNLLQRLHCQPVRQSWDWIFWTVTFTLPYIFYTTSINIHIMWALTKIINHLFIIDQ